MGVFCVGAPVFDHNGDCVGAISVTGIKHDLPSWRIAEIGQVVREHADEMSRLLGGPAFAEVTSAFSDADGRSRISSPATSGR